VKEILDVGCGSDARGTVNCDLYIEDIHMHRGTLRRNRLNALDIHSIPNFVRCDCQHLPFKDNVFDEVFSSQLIEHVNRPFLMFHEMVRVSKNIIIVETVHRLGEAFTSQIDRKGAKWAKEHHINKFNVRALNAYASACKCSIVSNYVQSYYSFPNSYICLFKVPYGIGMKCEKCYER
jgi:ubiquinone/menaquinone biosynthesis C-methylase UbiE